jgi:mannosyltransferase OCH1-like enzyme
MKKKIHFYWGGDKLPLFNALSIISFRKHNPEYKIILYKPTVNFNTPTWNTNEQKVKYIGDDYSYSVEKFVDEIKFIDLEKIGFSNNVHHAQKADILRQWLLLNEGGWWSDMDVVWVKNISSFNLENNYDVGVCWRNGYHNSGIMYSRPNTNFYNIIFNNLKSSFNQGSYQSAGPMLLNNLFPGIEHIQRTEQNFKVFNFELHNFAPLDSLNFPLLYKNGNESNVLRNDVYGVHWYNGGPDSGIFTNSFDVNEIPTSNILIYKIINSTIGFDFVQNSIKK